MGLHTKVGVASMLQLVTWLQLMKVKKVLKEHTEQVEEVIAIGNDEIRTGRRREHEDYERGV